MPPAKNMVPEEMSASAPEVLPPRVTSTMFCVCTDCVVSQAGTAKVAPDEFSVAARVLPAVVVRERFVPASADPLNDRPLELSVTDANPVTAVLVPAILPEACVWTVCETLAVIVPLLRPKLTPDPFANVIPP